MGAKPLGPIFPIRAPDGTLAMWWIVGFVLALALTIGGAIWLVFQLFIAQEFSRNLIAAAIIVLAMGAYWLWTDYLPAALATTDRG